MSITPQMRTWCINFAWGRDAPDVTPETADVFTAQQDIRFLLERLREFDPYFDKMPYDPERGRKSAQNESDPCGRCGHPYYRHFDWMEDNLTSWNSQPTCVFLCHDCIKNDKVKVLNKDYAMLIIEIGRGSLGPCESCKKTKPCADV